MKRHYLSDVAFGAVLGMVAGRTVTIGHGHQFAITPVSAGDSASLGAGLTWVGRK
jgi:membrane-associated phospholipid phosphatase